jgi:hypothetical protein
MPPKGRLSPKEIEQIAAWIDGLDQRAITVKEKPISAADRTFWSFAPPREPKGPSVKQGGWVRTPIDAFVLAALEKHGLSPSPAAERRTLIRRATLALTGLPPTPEEVHAFVSDARPDAYERLIDRLLASPHYGERWAQHWLDLARYADSNGFTADSDRPHAYRYRDWVIRAFNDDKPYDRFPLTASSWSSSPGMSWPPATRRR